MKIAGAEAKPHVPRRFCTACWNGSCGRSCLWHRAPCQTWQVPWEATPRMACLPKQAAAAACLPAPPQLHRMALAPPPVMALMLTWCRETPGGLPKVSLLCNVVPALLSSPLLSSPLLSSPLLSSPLLSSPLLSSPLLSSPLLSSAASGHNTVQSSVCCANHLIAVLFSWILLIGQAADSELQ